MMEEGGKDEFRTTEDKINKVKHQLESVFDPDFTILGHGTWIEKGREIIQKGLESKVPKLDSTTVPLFDHDKVFEDQPREYFEKFIKWPHLGANCIVVVMIPNVPEGSQVGGHLYFDSVFEDLKTEDTGYNNRCFIPNKYIRGYFDVQNLTFVSNPDFKPEPLTIKQISTVTPPKTTSQKEPTPIPQAISASKNSDTDVW